MKKKILIFSIAILAFFAGHSSAHAAIALDATSSLADGSAGTTVTFDHTVSGDNTVLILTINNVGAGIISATFDGTQSFLPLENDSVANGGRGFTFYILSPHSGTHTIDIEQTSGGQNFQAFAASYTGVHDVIIGNKGEGTGTNMLPSYGVTTIVNDSLVLTRVYSGFAWSDFTYCTPDSGDIIDTSELAPTGAVMGCLVQEYVPTHGVLAWGGQWSGANNDSTNVGSISTILEPGTNNGQPDNNPNLEFLYPTDLSTTPLFSPFLLRANNLLNTNGYQVRIQYYVTEYGSTTRLSRDFSGFAFGTGAQFSQSGISIPRQDFGVDFATSTTLHAAAQLYSTQDPNNPGADLAFPIMIASSSISATLQSIPQSGGDFVVPQFTNNTTSTISTSTRPVGAVESPTFDTFNDCAADTTFDLWKPQDWKCLILNTANDFIASTEKFGVGTVDSLTQKIKTVFPFSVFTKIDEVIGAAQATNEDATITLGGHGTFGGRTFTILTASSTDWVTNTVGFDYKALEDKLLDLMTFCIIILESAYMARSLMKGGGNK